MLLLSRPDQRRAPLAILLVEFRPVVEEELEHLFTGSVVHGNMQAVFPVFTADLIGALPLLEKPAGALDAAT